MKPSTLIFFTLLLSAPLMAQKAHTQKPAAGAANPFASIDARAAQIPDSLTGSVDGMAAYLSGNFPDENQRVRAIFAWITSHVQYDIDNMFAINFYSDTTEKIVRALHTRKGICENYALLFNSLCNRTGIPAELVIGYTRQKGFADYIPHAWSVARLNGNWELFDPTWGSGYVQDGKFYQRLNNEFFNASPEAMIKSHMPFDPLWQLSFYPVTNQEFYEGKTAPDKNKPYFNYPDSIAAYRALSAIGRTRAEAIRVEKNGVRNSLIFDRLAHLKVDVENWRRQQEVDRQNGYVDQYNSALQDYNDAVKQFNVFIAYRNTQFRPAKPDAEIQQMLDSADHLASAARSKAAGIPATEEKVTVLARKLVVAIDEVNPQIAEQEAWLKKYLGKGKLARKMMFYK